MRGFSSHYEKIKNFKAENDLQTKLSGYSNVVKK
jgi:hypothetical protein